MISLEKIQKSSPISILGFGKEGQASLRYLLKSGFTDITVLDGNTSIDTSLFPASIKFILGEGYLDTLGQFELIVKSPGISPFQKKILPYREKLISGTQIFFQNYGGNVIGITGTKGKSTVSTLVYKVLLEAGFHVKLVGNIGTPVLDEIDVFSTDTYDYVIYEMSSYMLQDFCPKLFIGYINNIHECHLDWHTTMDIYSQSKYNILTNAEHSITHHSLTGGETQFPSEKGYSYQNHIFSRNSEVFMDDSDIQILGEHNRVNICGVLTILEYIISDTDQLKSSIMSVLKDFQPLPHRLENIGTFNNRVFIDDGIAVTPEATIAAINSFEDTLQTLLTGGKDIGMNQKKLEQKITHSSICNLVLFPDTGYSLFPEYTSDKNPEEVFEFELNGRTIQALKTTSMESAVVFALEHTSPEKIVLLSSAAQSYSLWKSFEEKGKQYKHFLEQHATVS